LRGGLKFDNCDMGEMGALTGIEVKHNRRYGADCVLRPGPIEIVAKIAAPHQNEGPHLAAGLRARISADRSGARGKNDVPGNQRPTRSNEPKDPERFGSSGGSAPIPLVAIVRGEEGPVKTSLRRAKNGRGLDRALLSAKRKQTDMGEWELCGLGAGAPNQQQSASRWSAARCHASDRLLNIFCDFS
jgi:hypothetical protein